MPRRLLALFVFAAASPAVVDAQDGWVEVESANFRLISDAGEGSAKDVLVQLEQFRSTLSWVLPNQDVYSPIPTQVIAFRDSRSYERFYPVRDGKTQVVAGYFSRGPYKNIITLDLGARREEYYKTIFHEYVHLILSYNNYAYPLWLEEGLAQFYANSTLGDDYAHFGLLDKDTLRTLYAYGLIPLERFLEAGRSSSYYTEPNARSMFHAQSWALMHYLMTNQGTEGIERLVQFLRMLYVGRTQLDAFEKVFGMDIDETEQRLNQYVRRTSFPYYRFELEPMDLNTDFATRQLASGETSTYLGELMVYTGRLEEGAAYLQEALKQRPDLALTYETLGFLSLLNRDLEPAVDLFEKAIGFGSSNHMVYVHYAHSLLGGWDADLASIPEENVVAAVDSLRESLRLSPGFGDAAESFSFLCLRRNQDLDEAVEAIRESLAFMPGKPSLVFMLGQLLERQEDYPGAGDAFTWVSRTARDAELRASADRRYQEMQARLPSQVAAQHQQSNEDWGFDRAPSVSEPRTVLEIQGVFSHLDCSQSGPFVTITMEERALTLRVEPEEVAVLVNGVPRMDYPFDCGPQSTRVEARYQPMEGGASTGGVNGTLLLINLLIQ